MAESAGFWGSIFGAVKTGATKFAGAAEKVLQNESVDSLVSAAAQKAAEDMLGDDDNSSKETEVVQVESESMPVWVVPAGLSLVLLLFVLLLRRN